MACRTVGNVVDNQLDKIDPERAREIRAKGGKAVAKARHFNCSLRKALEERLAQGSTMEELADAAIDAAINEHNVAAFVFIRDTIGQKPADKKEITAEVISTEQRDAALKAYLLSVEDEKEEEA